MKIYRAGIDVGSTTVKLVILDEYMTTEPYGFALAFGNEALVAEMDALLNKWVADGTIEAIFTEYEQDYEAPKA